MDHTMYKGNQVETFAPHHDRWIQIHFSALNLPGCQTKWQYSNLPNSKHYRANSQSCNETNHHTHWYCQNCFTCANPYGNHVPTPGEFVPCKCNQEEDEEDYSDIFDLYSEQENDPYNGSMDAAYQDIVGSSNENEVDHWIEPEATSSGAASYVTDISYSVDWENEPEDYDLRQNLHEIYMQQAEYRQVIVRRMDQNLDFYEVTTTFVTICTTCQVELSHGINHQCLIGYEPGQQHPEMNPAALVNDVWWEIPTAVQQENDLWHNNYGPQGFSW